MTFNEYQEELWHLKNDSMSMFEKRLLNGNITCIEPYFDGHAILQRSRRYIREVIWSGVKTWPASDFFL